MEEVMTFQAKGTVLDKLKQLGINERRLELMPDTLKVPLLRGEVTPVFIANMETSNGKVIQLPLKAQFVRDDNEQVLLMTYPLRREIANELGLNQNELQRVQSGEVIRKEVDVEGERKVRFIRLTRQSPWQSFANHSDLCLQWKKAGHSKKTRKLASNDFISLLCKYLQKI